MQRYSSLPVRVYVSVEKEKKKKKGLEGLFIILSNFPDPQKFHHFWSQCARIMSTTAHKVTENNIQHFLSQYKPAPLQLWEGTLLTITLSLITRLNGHEFE